MNTAYIVKGRIINHDTIKLAEPVPIDDDEVHVVIEPKDKIVQKRIPGLLKGKIHIAPDFNAPLEDFKEYME